MRVSISISAAYKGMTYLSLTATVLFVQYYIKQSLTLN